MHLHQVIRDDSPSHLCQRLSVKTIVSIVKDYFAACPYYPNLTVYPALFGGRMGVKATRPTASKACKVILCMRMARECLSPSAVGSRVPSTWDNIVRRRKRPSQALEETSKDADLGMPTEQGNACQDTTTHAAQGLLPQVASSDVCLRVLLRCDRWLSNI